MSDGYNKRRSGNRKEYKTLILVCEGEKTEPIYFNHYKERRSGLRILTPNSTVTDPENLVNFALRQIKKYDLDIGYGDQVWCVFDADGNKKENIEKAKALAGNKVKLCLSNPCFELWYLLHFYYFDNKTSTAEVQQKLNRYIKNYDKTKDYFDLLISNREKAIKNSKKVNNKHFDNGMKSILDINSNPSTQVHEIVEYILNTIKENKNESTN